MYSAPGWCRSLGLGSGAGAPSGPRARQSCSDRSHLTLGSYSSTTAEPAWIGPGKRVSSSCPATTRRVNSPVSSGASTMSWPLASPHAGSSPTTVTVSTDSPCCPLSTAAPSTPSWRPAPSPAGSTGIPHLQGRSGSRSTPGPARTSWWSPTGLSHELGDLVTVGTAELASVVNHSVAEGPLLQADGPLDDTQMGYLTEWLTGVGTALTNHWYRHRPATAESWDDLCGKVQSILNEQLLSAKARRAGIPVLPLASAYTLGRFEPTSLSYRLLAGAVRAEPRRSPRLLDGLAGRNLVAMRRWRGQRGPLTAPAPARPALGRCFLRSLRREAGAQPGSRELTPAWVSRRTLHERSERRPASRSGLSRVVGRSGERGTPSVRNRIASAPTIGRGRQLPSGSPDGGG